MKRRREMAVATVTELRSILNDTQRALFRNRTAVMRRPPAMHVAATLWNNIKSLG